MLAWTEDSLWQKTRLLLERAKQNSREGPLFAFWSTLALEMLARSVLASVHPVLLADIRGDERTVDNLFYACGLDIDKIKHPISISAKTVFLRCERLIPELSAFKAIWNDLLTRRNEDVHSGGPGFQNFEVKSWISDYYQIAELLLAYRSLSLEHMFGTQEAQLAEKTIRDRKTDDKKKVLDQISKVRRAWEMLDETARLEKKKGLRPASLRLSAGVVTKDVSCPSCGSQGRIIGNQIYSGPTRLDGTTLTQDVTALPTSLICNMCGLRIVGYENLRAADLGAEFTVTESPDPIDFHAINLSEYVQDESYYEPEYGND